MNRIDTIREISNSLDLKNRLLNLPNSFFEDYSISKLCKNQFFSVVEKSDQITIQFSDENYDDVDGNILIFEGNSQSSLDDLQCLYENIKDPSNNSRQIGIYNSDIAISLKYVCINCT